MNLLTKRISAVFIDFVILCIISIPFIILLLVFFDNILSHIILLSFLYTTFLCRDLFKGRSFGKQINKLCIESLDNKNISNIRLIFRKIFNFIWPLELLICAINPSRKLGDLICGTKIVLMNNNVKPENLPNKLNKPIIIIYFSIVLIITFFIFYLSINILITHNKYVQLLW